jgi:hypothetical protein
MQVARGRYCGGFPKPGTPFQPRPFFGEYSSTGGARRGTGVTGPAVEGAAPSPQAPSGDGGDDGGGGAGTGAPSVPAVPDVPGVTGKGKYPPSQYDSPPQELPDLPGGVGGGAPAPPG